MIADVLFLFTHLVQTLANGCRRVGTKKSSGGKIFLPAGAKTSKAKANADPFLSESPN